MLQLASQETPISASLGPNSDCQISGNTVFTQTTACMTAEKQVQAKVNYQNVRVQTTTQLGPCRNARVQAQPITRSIGKCIGLVFITLILQLKGVRLKKESIVPTLQFSAILDVTTHSLQLQNINHLFHVNRCLCQILKILMLLMLVTLSMSL